MGWNSWNHFSFDISESLILEIADLVVKLNLDTLGYKYINIDDGWANLNRSSKGHITVNETKFPNGMKHLAD